MRLFKRKPPIDDQAPRCPACHERVPEGASACAMCGRELHDVAADDDQRVAAARGRD
jgi:predicted amidophosphoribosyltransferase